MRCITQSYGRVKGNAKRYPYFQGAIYRAEPRKSDGVLIWKYCQHVGTARRSVRLANQDVREFAGRFGFWITPARHNSPVVLPSIYGE